MEFKAGDIVKHVDWEHPGIVVATEHVGHTGEVFIVVQWSTGNRGYWKLEVARMYLKIV